MSARLAFFVTGAGTELGKTFVASGLARVFRARGHAVAVRKPVMSGFDPARPGESDAGRLLEAAGLPVTEASLDAVSPWRFALPLSPDMAAVREGRDIDFTVLLQFCRGAVAASPDVLLVAGVGGAMAPVGGRHTNRDLAQALGIPAILVGGTYLGAISHLLTAAAALDASGVELAALVLSESETSPVPPAEIADTVRRHRSGTAVALVRRGEAAGAGLATLAAVLERGGSGARVPA